MSGKQLVAVGTVCLTGLGVVAGVTVCVVAVAKGIQKVIDTVAEGCCECFADVVEEILS